MQRRRTAVAVPQNQKQFNTFAERFATETSGTKLFMMLTTGIPSAVLAFMFWMEVFA